MKPICIDLFCGLGGWSEGFLAEGYRCVGFDIERHDYGCGYPGELVLQDIFTLDGSQLKDAACVVASPPCQRYSYMAMPWKRAKSLIAWHRESPERIKKLNALFDACFRIQIEASKAAGRYIPLIVENVRGAQVWVGHAKCHYGSFYLWGDVPALMPFSGRQRLKYPAAAAAERMWKDREVPRLNDGFKTAGMDWNDRSKRGQDFTRVAGRFAGERERERERGSRVETTRDSERSNTSGSKPDADNQPGGRMGKRHGSGKSDPIPEICDEPG